MCVGVGDGWYHLQRKTPSWLVICLVTVQVLLLVALWQGHTSELLWPARVKSMELERAMCCTWKTEGGLLPVPHKPGPHSELQASQGLQS